MDVSEPVDVGATPLTLNTIIKAFHTAVATQSPTVALPPISVSKGIRQDLGGARRLIMDIQDGLGKQTADTRRRFSQMVNQIAHLVGSVEQIESPLRPAKSSPESWDGPSGGGALPCSPVDLNVGGWAIDAVNRVIFSGNARGRVTHTQSP